MSASDFGENLEVVSDALEQIRRGLGPDEGELLGPLDRAREALEAERLAQQGRVGPELLAEEEGLAEPEPLELDRLAGLQQQLQDVSFPRDDGARLTSHLGALNTLLDVSANALGATTVDDLLERVVTGARQITGARLSLAGSGHRDGLRLIRAASGRGVEPTAALQEAAALELKGPLQELLERVPSMRRPADPGEGLEALIGVRLVGREGAAEGYLIVVGRDEGDFTAEEEALLSQLAVFTSLGLQHILSRGERKRAEAELLAARERLLRQEKLAFLGALAGGVGHELRTPLGSIKNAAYFLKLVIEAKTPEIREALDILEREVGTTESIIMALLDFARPRPPERRPIDANELLRATLEKVERPASIEVRWRLASAVSLTADPGQLGQVFSNILNNAVQAMPDGGRLEIVSAVEEEDAVITITDEGVGIAEEHLTELFEPLFTTKARGIGLGLSVAQTLIKRQGGLIEVESELGRGSSFTVRLPTSSEEGSS